MTTFSVAVHQPSKPQSEAISAVFRAQGLAWWHWIEGYWLVSDPTDQMDPVTIKDLVKPICPGSNILVLKLAPGTHWAGSGRPKGDKKMFPWLRRNVS